MHKRKRKEKEKEKRMSTHTLRQHFNQHGLGVNITTIRLSDAMKGGLTRSRWTPSKHAADEAGVHDRVDDVLVRATIGEGNMSYVAFKPVHCPYRD